VNWLSDSLFKRGLTLYPMFSSVDYDCARMFIRCNSSFQLSSENVL
jgi:hypothetical protein